MLVSTVTTKNRPIKQTGIADLQGGQGSLAGTGFVADELPSYTYWNPLDKSANITLSGSDLIATATSGIDAAVRAVDKKTAGKWYIEIKDIENASLSSSAGVGLASGSIPLANVFTAVTDTIALLGNGSIFLDEVFIDNITASIVGSTIGIAYDADAHLVWIRENGDDWNGDPDADPAAGLGGIDVSGIDGDGLYPAAGTGDTGDSWQLNAGTTEFEFTRPFGFVGWTTEGS